MTFRALPWLSILTLAACSAPSSAGTQPSAGNGDNVIRTLAVSGLGEAAAAPDQAMLQIGVQADSATAAEALKSMSARIAATMARLKSGGVLEKDIQTSGLSLNPRYNYQTRPQNPQIIGYTASTTLSVKLRDIAKAGALIDAAVSDGANTLGGLTFGFADTKPLENAARADAVADAKSKAEVLAKAAGVSLGPILQINDGYAAPTPQPLYEARAASVQPQPAVPIAPGESTLSASVTLIYAIN